MSLKEKIADIKKWGAEQALRNKYGHDLEWIANASDKERKEAMEKMKDSRESTDAIEDKGNGGNGGGGTTTSDDPEEDTPEPRTVRNYDNVFDTTSILFETSQEAINFDIEVIKTNAKGLSDSYKSSAFQTRLRTFGQTMGMLGSGASNIYNNSFDTNGNKVDLTTGQQLTYFFGGL